jgi:hypothetical protein
MTTPPRALIALASALLLAACSSGSATAPTGTGAGSATGTATAGAGASAAGSGPSATGTASGTASGASAGATSGADGGSVAFGAEKVGSFGTGSPGAPVEAMLRERLGAPGKVAELKASCVDINPQPPTRRLSWGSLTVILSHEKKGLVLLGWSVTPGALPAGVQLPHGVTTTTSVPAALKAIPAARGNWDETFQLYEITAGGDAGMVWAGEKADGSGPVTLITNSFVPCD